MSKQGTNVPARAARNGGLEARVISVIMEAFSRRPYRCQVLIKYQIGRSGFLIAHPTQPSPWCWTPDW
jgi:hypothetical protein